MSIRWKIAILCIVLSVLPIALLNRYTVRVFDGFTRRMQEERMIDYATVVATDYSRLLKTGEDPQAFAARLVAYHQRFKARLQVVGADGAVWHDSDPDAAGVEDRIEGREIGRALEGRYGARTELMPDRQLLFYHIALPIRDADGDVVAAARVSQHTRDITRAIRSIFHDYRLSMLAAFAVSALAAILLSYPLTRRLRALSAAMSSFARGDSAVTPAVGGRDEIGALGLAFQRMAGELRDNNERQSSLLASTTHELKTPITAIKGAVEMLRDGGAIDDPEACARFLGNIEICSDRLLRMVEQLAALSKLKTEELRGRKVSLDYGAFVRATVARLYPSPAVPIRTEVDDGLPHVAIIPERIEQVLANLLENAMRYTPPDGSITITVEARDGMVATTVADTGAGIDAADLPNVFRQFFTTVPKASLKEYGSGLGLAIAESIVQNHGGDIRVASRRGEGSRFTFTLPV